MARSPQFAPMPPKYIPFKDHLPSQLNPTKKHPLKDQPHSPHHHNFYPSNTPAAFANIWIICTNICRQFLRWGELPLQSRKCIFGAFWNLHQCRHLLCEGIRYQKWKGQKIQMSSVTNQLSMIKYLQIYSNPPNCQVQEGHLLSIKSNQNGWHLRMLSCFQRQFVQCFTPCNSHQDLLLGRTMADHICDDGQDCWS